MKSKRANTFYATNLNENDEHTQWTIYNTIREIEATFRVLKTDLDLRPVYHKTDEAAMAQVKEIYTALKFKDKPFTRKKSVVPLKELSKKEIIENQLIPPD